MVMRHAIAAAAILGVLVVLAGTTTATEPVAPRGSPMRTLEVRPSPTRGIPRSTIAPRLTLPPTDAT